MKLYKLTEQDNTTFYGSMKWEIGTTNKVVPCKNPKLCTSDVIHAYRNINLALLLNPVHAGIAIPKIYECEGNIVVEDFDKCGVFSLKPVAEMPLPAWYINKNLRGQVQVCFAILCASSVLSHYEKFNKNDLRPKKAIEAAKHYLLSLGEPSTIKAAAWVAEAAAWAAAAEAARAAGAARAAAGAAARAAEAAARAAEAARAAAWVARAAARAARAAGAAARAAEAAARAAEAGKLDCCKLADKAVKIVLSGNFEEL